MKYRDISSLQVSTVLVLKQPFVKQEEMERGGQSERILPLATVCSQKGITKQQVNADMDLSACLTSQQGRQPWDMEMGQ